MLCQAVFSTLSLSLSTQAAPLLCVPLTTARHSRALSLPTEAFSGARRALCHLRSRMEEVCREEMDKISRAGTADPGDPGRRTVIKDDVIYSVLINI